ncbi:MAG: hypothetical protein QW051_03140 [Candidatus Aenigmatarchaeota archaeon]
MRNEEVTLLYSERIFSTSHIPKGYESKYEKNINYIFQRYKHMANSLAEVVGILIKVERESEGPRIKISGPHEKVEETLLKLFENFPLPPETKIILDSTTQNGYNIAKKVIKTLNYRIKESKDYAEILRRKA